MKRFFQDNFMFTILITLFIGVICDVGKFYFVIIDDIKTLSLTIMQIQTTIGVLIITILSLLAGNLGESYYGVSICDYYLNIKPNKFTFIKIIFIILVLSLISIVAYAFDFYSTILCIFIIVLFCVVTAIEYIYYPFSGRKIQTEEIKKYILNSIENLEISIDDVFERFCSDWEKNITKQDTLNYKEAFGIYKKFIERIIKEEDDKKIQMLQIYSAELCSLCFNTYNSIIQERGMELIGDVYSVLNSKIKTVSNSFNIEFHLFNEVGYNLIEILDSMDNRYIECSDFDINSFFYDILIFCIKMKKENKKNSVYDTEISMLKVFAASIGKYIHVQKYSQHILNEIYWINIFQKRETFTSAEIENSKSEYYSESMLEIYFDYFYGLLMNREEGLIVNGIFKNFFDQLIYFENSYQIIFILSVFSYLYYIGFEENIIDGKIKECAQSILKNSDVRNSYINLQYLIYEKICNNWDIKIYESLLSLIKKYEVPERYGALKCSNIEEVILKFYIFIITSIFYNHVNSIL